MKKRIIIFLPRWKFPLFWSGAGAVAVYPRLFVNASVYNKEGVKQGTLTNDELRHYSSMLVHEQVHHRQQRKDGWKWYLKYIFSTSYRFEQELQAYRTQAEFVKIQYNVDIKEGVAKALSSKTYFKMAGYKKAKKAIEEWDF